MSAQEPTIPPSLRVMTIVAARGTSGPPAPGTGTSTGTVAYANRISGVRFTTQNLLLSIDELRIGTTFDDVVVAVPEPASLLLVGLGGLAMLSRRKS